MCGMIAEIFVVLFFMFILPSANFRDSWILPVFLVLVAINVFALPFIIAGSATLMSNFTDESQQSTIQGTGILSWKIGVK